ncbi:DUF5996 family protein [Streptomyces albidoflavus]|uniref:DUF5996 family protein n=1 Tax=Streptomyces albidoflavus TaxID=1886 RepID=UPI0020D23579|nr:DUF5996 family protein [Streptomyces albidoflavus]
MSQRGTARPDLDYEHLAPTADYVNRVVQVGGKYTLDEPFEVGWGNVVLDVTPRGLATRTFRRPDTSFQVHYGLLDGDVRIESDRGTRALSLRHDSVASFYTAFCDAARDLGVDPPDSPLICEIPDSPATFEEDRAARTWDPDAARLMCGAWNLAAAGLETWQARRTAMSKPSTRRPSPRPGRQPPAGATPSRPAGSTARGSPVRRLLDASRLSPVSGRPLGAPAGAGNHRYGSPRPSVDDSGRGGQPYGRAGADHASRTARDHPAGQGVRLTRR